MGIIVLSLDLGVMSLAAGIRRRYGHLVNDSLLAATAAREGIAWSSEGWLGAVLDSADFTAAGSIGAQRGRIERLLNSAVDACRQLLAS